MSTLASSLTLNWSSSISCCQWEGIKCNTNGRVTHLELPFQGLKGIIPSSITRLGMLTHLNLSNNYLDGPLGEEITSLINLIIIDLSSNNILGSIPHDIGKLVYLKKLHLYENNLTGSIPSSLMNCTHLEELILRDNHFNGDISKLDFSRLVQLQKLDLKNNSLSGTFPESIYSCKSLIAIRIARNNITGSISSKLGELKSLSFVSLSINSLTNITMTLRVFAKCKSLTTLFISFNYYGESLPIDRNFIRLGEYPKHQFLNLRNCHFVEGPFPNWLSIMSRLRVLRLDGNRITGKVPDWLGTLPNLFRLDINNNSLFGEFPLQLCKLPALVSQNESSVRFFQFELPVFLFRGNTYIRFLEDYYHGLDLSDNELSGTIPKEIGNLQNLQQLYLYNNHFSGHIPISISHLKMLELLNLSTNNLTGEIPASLASLSFLSQFDVSYNDLQGVIPSGGQFGTFEQSSFEGNSDLCGLPLKHPCFKTTTLDGVVDQNKSHENKQQFLEGFFVGLASGFSCILIVIAPCVWLNARK